MVALSLAEVAKATGAALHGDPTVVVSGVALDSRTIRGGELFVALPGHHTDGHAFLPAAFANGAAAALVARASVVPQGPELVVPDPLAALHELTRAVRQRCPQHLVAITGSAGKTTTKEILAAFLASRFRVAKSPGNLNNLLGFPVALLGIDETTEWMVAEMGMSTPGELAGVSRLGRPDICVFTNVGSAHLGGLGSREALIAAKAELLEGLRAGGVVVANANNAGTRAIAASHVGPVVWFGDGAPYRAEHLTTHGFGSRFELVTPAGRAIVELPLFGAHNVANFVAAAAVAGHLGIGAESCAEVATTLGPLGGRGVVQRLPSGTILVDDAYNANPEATQAALSAAAELATNRKAVLGAMLELGATSPDLHREVGAHAATLGFDVLAVGEEARPLAQAAGGHWVEDATAAVAAAAARWSLGPGDVLLVKGSRGIGLERVVQALTQPQTPSREGVR